MSSPSTAPTAAPPRGDRLQQHCRDPVGVQGGQDRLDERGDAARPAASDAVPGVAAGLPQERQGHRVQRPRGEDQRQGARRR